MRTRFYHTKSMDKAKKPFIQKEEAYDFKNKSKDTKITKVIELCKGSKNLQKKVKNSQVWVLSPNFSNLIMTYA